MLVTEKRITGSDGAPVHLTVWEPDGRARAALQLVHGFGECAGRYARWARLFTERGWAVYACDLRGHGKTPGKRGVADCETLLGDMVAVRTRMAAEQPGLPVSLYGHSLGGSLVLNSLLRARASDAAPEDYVRAVAASPWLAPHRAYPSGFLGVLQAVTSVMPNLTMRADRRREQLSGDALHLDRTLRDGPYHTGIGARLLLQALDAGQYAIHHASGLRTPLLLLYGEQDQVVSQDAILAFADSARLTAPSSSNLTVCACPQRHELHNGERRGELFERILAFLEADGAPDPNGP